MGIGQLGTYLRFFFYTLKKNNNNTSGNSVHLQIESTCTLALYNKILLHSQHSDKRKTNGDAHSQPNSSSHWLCIRYNSRFGIA